ncbi:MAG: hypothetical protein ABSA76_11450 [Bacteroidales bacterium]
MENLTFIHRGQRLSKKIYGGIIIAAAIIFLILDRNSLKLSNWLGSILLIFLGVIETTRLSGSDKSCIGTCEGTLKILWRGWIREISIPDDEIEKITLTKDFILIRRKGKKAKRMYINAMENDQKTQVYEFLIEYSQHKNIPLEK